MKKWYALIIAILYLSLSACTSTSPSDDEPPLLAYCDLVANPSQYDGQVVRVSASYIFGFELSFLTDEKCSSKSLDDKFHTWIVIYRSTPLCENASQVSTFLTPQEHDSNELLESEVIVRGIFHNSKIGFAQREYTFNMEFICLEKAGKWQVVQNE